MFSELAEFLYSMQIMAVLESRKEAETSCAQHGTDIEGRWAAYAPGVTHQIHFPCSL